jgi:hypothetical protein
MSKAWNQRPSSLYGIKDPYEAYCFDRAVMYFGAAYEADMDKAASGAKNQGAIERRQALVAKRWMTDEDDEETKPKFRDPAEYLRERGQLNA